MRAHDTQALQLVGIGRADDSRVDHHLQVGAGDAEDLVVQGDRADPWISCGHGGRLDRAGRSRLRRARARGGGAGEEVLEVPAVRGEWLTRCAGLRRAQPPRDRHRPRTGSARSASTRPLRGAQQGQLDQVALGERNEQRVPEQCLPRGVHSSKVQSAANTASGR